MHKNTSNALKYTNMHSFVLFNYAKNDSKWTKYAKLEWRQSRTTAINTNNCEYNVIEILAIRFRRFQTDQKCISNRFEPDSRYFRFLINRFFRVNHVRKDHKPWGRVQSGTRRSSLDHQIRVWGDSDLGDLVAIVI